ncbi:hypothetical protein ACQPZX_39660 [Actinoplanes sp. CA-142083]|uniref:hypothetical protein n=1 Tax=Actinoplanes sp. CA-142083 TaxID=3239903 RepID=UPI003D904CFB
MTTEDQPANGFAARMAFARQTDPLEAPRRTHLHLKLIAVTLAWLVSVPLLSISGLLDLAALLTLLGPFVAAVIATKNHRFGLGGGYIVLTLLMVLPAVALSRL